MENTQLYRAYNDSHQILCYAGRVDEDLEDGYVIVATGSARLVVKRALLEPVYIGDTFKHWEHGWLRIDKINRKTMVCTKPDTTRVKLEIR